MKYKAAYYTDVGIKKKNNQDSLAIKIAETYLQLSVMVWEDLQKASLPVKK